MAKTITLASLSAKGHWRGGIFHAAKATSYEVSEFTEEQLGLFDADPRLNIVRDVDGASIEPEMSSVSTLVGSSSLPAVIQIADKINLQLGELVAFAQQQSEMDEPSWNGLEEEERDVLLASSLDLLKATATAALEKKGKPNVDKVVEALKALGVEDANVSGDVRDAAFAVFKDEDFKN